MPYINHTGHKPAVKFVSVESGITALGFRKIAAIARKLDPKTEICFIAVSNLYSIISHIFPSRNTDFDDQDIKIVAEYLAEADLVCFSSMTPSSSYVEKIAKLIKNKNPHTYILWGGAHVIINPKAAIKHVDAICTGEGQLPYEIFYKYFSSNKNYYNTPGMWFNTSSGIKKNANLPVNQSDQLNRFPHLYYGLDCKIYDLKQRKFRLFNKFDYMQNHGLTYRTVWTLGCPYACIYCANDVFAKLDPNHRKIRYSSINYLIEEIGTAIKIHPYISTVAFYDDNFIAVPLDDLIKFTQEYNKKIQLPFVVFGLHPNITTEDKVRLLAEAGMNRVRMGIQSGNKKTLAFFNRPTSLSIIRSSVGILAKYAKKYNMIPPSYDIISDNPFEKKQDVINNLKFIYKLKRPFTLNIFSLRVFPNTKLWDYFQQCTKFDIRALTSSYLETRQTMDNIILYLLAAFKPPKFVFNYLLEYVNGYQDKQKFYPRLHLLIKLIYLTSRSIQHLIRLDFSVIVGWWTYYIWRLALIKKSIYRHRKSLRRRS